MAATNYTPIQLYHSTTASAVPVNTNLVDGELAINITDGKLYYKDNGGTVRVIATKATGTIGGSDTQVQYNSSGSLAGSANFTFNGTTASINTLNLTNALGATYGGTAQSSWTAGDLLYASGSNTLAKLAIGLNTYILTSNGTIPGWAAPSAISVNTATNLAGGAAGSVPYQSGAGATTFLSIGTANQVVTSTGTAPQWSSSLEGLITVDTGNLEVTNIKANDGTAAITITDSTGAVGVSTAFTLSTATGNIALGTSQTTGTLTAGGTAATGTITVDQSTKTHTLNVGSGATENAATKTVNIATGGVSGSTTTITIGSANGTSTTLNGTVTAATLNSTTIDTTNLEVTNVKAKDGTAAIVLTDSTGAVAVSTALTANGGAVFNENGANVDFRVEGDTDANLIFADASADAVGIGTNAPTEKLDVNGAIVSKAAATLSSGAGAYLYYTSGTSSAELTALNPSVAWLNQKYNALAHIWGISGTEKMRLTSTGTLNIVGAGTAGSTQAVSFNGSAPAGSMVLDASGRLLVGTTSNIGGNTIESVANVGVYRFTAAASGPFINLGKSRSATTGTNTIVQADDNLGTLSFYGANGTSYTEAAYIRAIVGGTPGASNDMPGALLFATTSDGAGSATERARITSGGEVYIAGTTDQGAYNLQVNGTGVWGAGAYVNGSDSRLKEEVATIESAIDVVTALRPVTFRYKESHSKDQSIQPGFIAQELQAAMAEKSYVDGIVKTGPEYLNVAYQSLIPLLTKAIQEQQAMINELKAEVAALKGA